MSIPHLFRCPITLDLFTDPVTLSTGHTYDRPSIEKWLSDGNLTCPVTMQRLYDTSVVPNHTLRHLIDQWLHTSPGLSPRRRSTKPIDDADADFDFDFSLSTLEQNLKSPDTGLATKLKTLKEVRILSVESEMGRACLIHLGFFPLLLQLLFQYPFLDDPELAEVALDCILSLSPSTHMDSFNILNQESNLASLVLLLDRGNAKIKTSLCFLLETIATSVATQELCLLLGRTCRVLQTLVSLLHDRSEAAVGAISSICSLEANRGNAIREGVMDGLVSYLSGPTRGAAKALATLELLMGMETGKRALMKNAGAVHVLVKLVFGVPDHGGCDHAVGSLLIMCRESARARVEAVNAGVVTQLLRLLQSQYGGGAKSNARALLKLLRAMWTEDPQEVCKSDSVM